MSNENQEEIATILEQTEKLDFLIQSLVKLSRMESGIIAVHSEDTTIAQMFASVQQQFNVKVREKNITLSYVTRICMFYVIQNGLWRHSEIL